MRNRRIAELRLVTQQDIYMPVKLKLNIKTFFLELLFCVVCLSSFMAAEKVHYVWESICPGLVVLT